MEIHVKPKVNTGFISSAHLFSWQDWILVYLFNYLFIYYLDTDN